jgi:hypothetical protein
VHRDIVPALTTPVGERAFLRFQKKLFPINPHTRVPSKASASHR